MRAFIASFLDYSQADCSRGYLYRVCDVCVRSGQESPWISFVVYGLIKILIKPHNSLYVGQIYMADNTLHW